MRKNSKWVYPIHTSTENAGGLCKAQQSVQKATYEQARVQDGNLYEVTNLKINAPEGYDDLGAYLNALKEETYKSLKPDKIINNTRYWNAVNPAFAFDYFMWDDAQKMSVEEWYDKKSEFSNQVNAAMLAKQKAARGEAYDPEDLKVTLKGVRMTLDELETFRSATNAISDYYAEYMRKDENAPSSLLRSDWNLDMADTRMILSVQSALDKAGVSKDFRDFAIGQYRANAEANMQKRYEHQLKAEKQLGHRLTPARHNAYEYGMGARDLNDTNSFLVDMHKQALAIDTSRKSRILSGTAQFLFDYEQGIKISFEQCHQWRDSGSIARDSRDALYEMMQIFRII